MTTLAYNTLLALSKDAQRTAQTPTPGTLARFASWVKKATARKNIVATYPDSTSDSFRHIRGERDIRATSTMFIR